MIGTSGKSPYLLLLFLLSFSLPSVRSQPAAFPSSDEKTSLQLPDTSAVNHLVLMADSLINSDPDRALSYAEQAASIAAKSKWSKGIATTQWITGRVYVQAFNNPQKALEYLMPALITFRELRDRKGEGLCLTAIGTSWYYKSEVDTALHYWNEALEIFKELKDRKEEVKVNFNLGNGWAEKGNVDKALECYEETVRIQSAAGNKDSEGKAHFNMGILYVSMGNLPKALDEQFKALSLFEQTGNSNSIANCSKQIADIYRLNGEYEKAIQVINRAIELSRKGSNKVTEQEAWLTLGMIYFDSKKHNQALAAYDSAQALGKITNNNRMITLGYRNIGTVYSSLDQDLKALDNFLKALSFSRKGKSTGYLTDLDKVGQHYLKIASLQNKSHLPDSLRNTGELKNKAKQYLEEAVLLGSKFKNDIIRKNAHSALSDLYKQEGNWEKAYKNYVIFHELQDQIFSNDNKVTIAKLEAKREMDIKQKELEIQKLELHSSNRARQLISGIAILILILIGLLFNRYRIKQRGKRIRELDNIRSRISRDLHDDIGSTLSSINLLAHTARKRLNENAAGKAGEQLGIIQDRTQRIVGNMRDIVWNIKPGNDTLDVLIGKMEEHVAILSNNSSITYLLNVPDTGSGMLLPLDVKHNLFMVFKEALNNLTKHSGGDQAEITLKVNKQNIELTIVDNGNGNIMEHSDGTGLHSMKSRANEINAELKIIAIPGQGTTISFIAVLP